MARRVKASASERQRRAEQSKRDKARAQPSRKSNAPRRASRSGGGGKPVRSVVSKQAGIHPYTKMILDPCNAKLTQTPLPGREGSSLFRLPFRLVVTIPTTASNVYGTPNTSTASQFNATTLHAVLVPSAMTVAQPAVGGASTISISTSGSETGAPWNNASIGTNNFGANYFWNTDPVGLNALNGISALCRPVAGCIKLEYYAPGSATTLNVNTGSFFGYEGVASNYYFQYTPGSTPGAIVPNASNSTFAMLGWSSGIVTEGVESAVNYAAANSEWQEFKQLNNPTLQGSPDAANQDISQMPIASVGVGGATPGTQYLISGAVVYEWVPTLNFGPSGTGSERPTARKQSVLDKVISQVAAYGPMLVGVASKLATGGPTLAISDLMYRLSINNYNGQPQQARPQIAWKS